MNEYISNPDEAREFQGRYRTLYIFITVVVSIFFLRLIWLQVISGNELRQYSEKNRIKQNKIFAPRGLILDREGKALIENLPGFEVLVSPQYIENIKLLAETVGPILGMEPTKVIEKIQRSKRLNGPFATVRLKDNLAREEVFRLKRIRLDTPGLEIRESILRHYPLNENGSQLFGYVGEISKLEIPKLNEKSPAPTMPTSTPNDCSSSRAHCTMRSIFGVTTIVGRLTFSMHRNDMNVLPVPVGMTTTPRRPPFSHACTASV